jgi:cytochrome c553
MKTIAVVLAAACWLGLAAQTHAQQAAKGEAQAARAKTSMCIGCHGIPLYKSVFPEVYHVPKIAGQQPQYIISALRAYRNGERNHPSMTGVAKGLSDQDIADLGAYYGAATGSGK